MAEVGRCYLDAGVVATVEVHHAWPELPRFSHQRNHRMGGQELDERPRNRSNLETIC